MSDSHYSIYFDSLKAVTEKDKRNSAGRESMLKVLIIGGGRGREREREREREGEGECKKVRKEQGFPGNMLSDLKSMS